MKNYTFQKIARLILLSLYGKAESLQIKELREWLQEDKAHEDFYVKILSDAYLEKGMQEYMQYDSRYAWEQMRLRIQKSRKNIARRLFPYAAAAVVLAGIAIFALFPVGPQSPVPQVATFQTIPPGSSKAQLILADGREIELEATNDRLCRKIEGECFLNDGKALDYTHQTALPDSATLHTLRIPRGGEYQLVLSDGTRVWLNADSELSYPDHFTEICRKVELKGEAYFEVSPDTARPFHVVIGDMDVQVLGTSFNVSAYPGDKRQTTLVAGSVAVRWQDREVTIRPGQQAAESKGGLVVKQVNVANHIGWKERRFIYEDQNLGEVLAELERWYDVDIIIADETINGLYLTANLPKYENIDKVLDIIRYAACVTFEIKDRCVIVRRD